MSQQMSMLYAYTDKHHKLKREEKEREGEKERVERKKERGREKERGVLLKEI